MSKSPAPVADESGRTGHFKQKLVLGRISKSKAHAFFRHVIDKSGAHPSIRINILCLNSIGLESSSHNTILASQSRDLRSS